jgi:hypothetical protein
VAEECREGVNSGEWDEVELVVLILAVSTPPSRIETPGFQERGRVDIDIGLCGLRSGFRGLHY